ncbi:hypothetical protein AVEN_223361-1 [Araneus ventricosus]|uniref:UPF3 domain-containing protein n=1 Tax=Araneus ventricosus TaxID=182803 RepID=A0A4Y2ULT3_ARAVE|nr:hypothetical protein AVEN_223361-1 [Araneus ventricosus]
MKQGFSNSQIIEESSESEEDEEQLPYTKVVIRHLPPGMKKDKFFQLVSPLPAHDYKYFNEADKVSWATHIGAHGFMDVLLHIFD